MEPQSPNPSPLLSLASRILALVESLLPAILVLWNDQLRRQRDAARALDVISKAKEDAALVELHIKTNPLLPTGRRALLERNLGRLRDLAAKGPGPSGP